METTMKAFHSALITGLLVASAAAAQGPTPLAVGQTLNAELSTDDLQSPDSTYYDLYRFRGEAGQAVVLTLTSTAFDGHLALQKGGTTQTLAADDNGGGGKNPRVAFTLPENGEFDIRATATDGGLGAYVLKLEAGAR
jgi:hypothetical protein